MKMGSLRIAASLKAWRSHEVEIKSFVLRDGSIRLFTDENGYSNLKSFLSEKTEDGETHKASFLKVLTDNMNVRFTNVDFNFTDAIKTTSIHANLEDLAAKLHLKDDGLAAEVDMSIFFEELVFKKENGSFAANSHLSGKLNMGISDGNIVFEPFPLSINEQVFMFGGNYDTRKKLLTKLTFENENTVWSQSMPLLTKDIQQKLELYHIEKPFYSKTTISSYFKPGEPILVNIDFRLEEENEVKAKTFLFEKVRLKGRFSNRLYDGERGDKEDGKNLKIALRDVVASYDVYKMDATDVLITSTPIDGARIKTIANINGQPSGISRWLKNDKFFFKKGHFNLLANVEGPLNDLNEIIVSSEAQLALHHFSVVYKPSDTTFPFAQLKLHKKQGDANFSIVSSTLENGHDFLIDGGLKNLNALLFALAERSSSKVNFVARKISWTDFVNLFGENGYLDDDNPKNDLQKKRSMKETIRGIQFHFQPRITASVDTLEYFDLLELCNFKTGVHFEKGQALVLENTSFKYEEGLVNLKAKLDVSKENITPFEFELHAKNLNLAKLLPPFDYFKVKLLKNIENLPENVSVDVQQKGILDDQKGLIPSTSTGEIIFQIDKGKTLLGKVYYEPAAESRLINQQDIKLGNSVKTKIALDGDPALFNQFFKTDRFFFSKGHFFAGLQYEGNVRDFEELLAKGDATFNLQNSEVYYKQADVSFPITEINLSLHEDDADFFAYMDKDSIHQKIELTGNIQNLSEVVVGNTGKEVKAVVDITSTKIRWAQFLNIFYPEHDDKPEKRTLALKETAKGILSAFNPDICVYLDTFIYSDKLQLYDVQTGISLKDSATLILDQTGFRFHDGSVRFQGSVDLGQLQSTPFTGRFQTDKLNAAQLLESLDYLDIPSFKDIEKLSGQVTLNLDLSGAMTQGGKGLVPEENSGEFNFELSNIVVKGFSPLDELAAKIRMKKRFEQLSFAPLENQLTIKGKDVQIPLMEIQSNAINMFIEGTYSYGDNTNIWVSIPLDNLKTPDSSVIPSNRGYAASKRKIYVEVTTDAKGSNKFKFHFRKKQFYKQRGIKKQYRADLKMYRKIRKEQKKGD
ncbi:MAG: AsmA-like C-terminal region-containing protein [Saprospiraceae bacterium]|nr:AsmA-like C-terminal region-containing protein [Saprospiraceae bacterium]MCF8249790.1 AsmA-like C-terminal region-containing protein [Saprospiraceae bacterium]MCF8279275.1 AsmA-like C-terminal region-containing protein [Bacteroidales bacterium]MCF8313459.1 AsmA-like C-terminal region-containing protein [Saprospiraceae bacterium]MCF8442172.1 AsmA-like C-terminal region-containing protein [Saprospiraceae bacterium]